METLLCMGVGRLSLLNYDLNQTVKSQACNSSKNHLIVVQQTHSIGMLPISSVLGFTQARGPVMLATVPTVSVTESIAQVREAIPSDRGPQLTKAFSVSGLERLLAPGDVLIKAGEPKTHVYRVKEGLVCTYSQGPGEAGRHIVGFSFIGDIVGLGALDRHMTTVEAGSDAIVQCLPQRDLDQLLEADEHLAARHAEATSAELELLKQALVAQGRADTMTRLAALLTVISSNNANEGRPADIITDDITCGFVADTLGLEVKTLEQALVGLERQGLIEPVATGGLRLRDRAGLERLAETRI